MMVGQWSTQMKLNKEMLLGYSNRRDEKNDTMVGCKGGGRKRRRRGWSLWGWW